MKNAIDRLCVEVRHPDFENRSPAASRRRWSRRLHFDTRTGERRQGEEVDRHIAKAAGISQLERVLIKLASTWEGFRAAEQLEKEGIHCNMTLLFGMHQAVAGAEAKVTLISPFVGRILDWYLKDTGRKSYAPAEDPGVVSVTKIFNYYKHFDYKTEVMGASFRNLGEITELAGCDLITIAPKFLAELRQREGKLPRKLDPRPRAKSMKIERHRGAGRGDRSASHARGRIEMAKDKLAEGIDGFTKAIVELEELIGKRLDATSSAAACVSFVSTVELCQQKQRRRLERVWVAPRDSFYRDARA